MIQKEKWNEFFLNAQDIIISFLKVALIYIIFYLSTSVFSLLDLSIDLENKAIIKKIQFWSLVIIVVLITIINLIKQFVILAKETIRGIREVQLESKGWHSYLPINEDISTQIELLNDCNEFRIQGLRLNKALNKNEFIEAISKVQKVKILIFAKITNARTSFEQKHNTKYENSIQILRNLILNGTITGSIEIRETNKFPKLNLLIFDDLLVRVKNYQIKKWSVKKSPIRIYHKLVHKNEVEEYIEVFDNHFSKAVLVLETEMSKNQQATKTKIPPSP